MNQPFPAAAAADITALRWSAALTLCLLSTSVMADDTNGYGVATAARARNAYDGGARPQRL